MSWARSSCSVVLVAGPPSVGFRQQVRRQQSRRDTIPPIIRTIQPTEVLVAEEVAPLRGQKAIERGPSHEVEVGMIRFKNPALRRSLPQHQALPSLPQVTTPRRDWGFTFRLDF